MAQWIEVRARYDKMMENGSVKKVTEPYLADALSCTEAEARVTEELQPFISGDFRISSVVTTKIAEIFWDETGDKFYKVKINFITLDEKTATEKKTASYILVQASSFKEAYDNFIDGMRGTMADYEIEAITETKLNYPQIMAKCANPFANGGRRNPAYEPKKRNKYGAQRVGEHASRKEHNRAVQLKLWQRAGVISNLREQVPFELIPAQYSVDTATSRIAKPKLIERACRYIADFVYTDNETGQTIVEDTKGVRTKEYIIKRKLMLFRHGIRIKEV